MELNLFPRCLGLGLGLEVSTLAPSPGGNSSSAVHLGRGGKSFGAKNTEGSRIEEMKFSLQRGQCSKDQVGHAC